MRTTLTTLAGAFLFCATLLTPVTAQDSAVESDVKAAYAAWDEAVNKGDAKAVATFYTDDAVLLPPVTMCWRVQPASSSSSPA